MKKLGLLFIHGIGDNHNIANSPFQQRVARLTNTLKARVGPIHADQIVFETVIWQDLIQKRQTEIFDNVRDLDINGSDMVDDLIGRANIKGFIRLGLKLFKKKVRKQLMRIFPVARGLLVSTLGDAAAVEHGALYENSVYTNIQRLIRQGLQNIYNEAGQTSIPVIIVSQSYGAHLISNYIWDSSKHIATAGAAGIGIWKHHPLKEEPEAMRSFLQCRSVVRFFSAANNIALFISGLSTIVPFGKPNPDFKWFSYWDTNDILGWPLKALHLPTHTPPRPYATAIHKEENLGMKGVFTHNAYWAHERFVNDLSAEMLTILEQPADVPV